jgi:pimeloyl-ACP methyl ester carboxylesterase
MERLTRTVNVDGAALFVEERGSGKPLLLLHGMAGTGADWKRLFDIDQLAQRFRVIIPDARGHGRSTNPSGEFTFARCAHDVLAILDALGIADAQAVGLSLGAQTLLHVATRAPSRITRMIVVSATPRFPEATRALFRTAALVERSPEEWARMRTLHVRGDEQIASLWRLPARFADDTTDMNFTPERLSAITARTLMVAGDRDPFYSRRAGTRDVSRRPALFAVDCPRRVAHPRVSGRARDVCTHGDVLLGGVRPPSHLASPYLVGSKETARTRP